MFNKTYINIASRDIPKNRTFYQAIGFELITDWSDDSTSSFKINDTTYLMVMNVEKFTGFTKSDLPNSFLQNEVILSFELEGKEAVDDLLMLVKSNGGSEFGSATDSDFMYYRAFRDTDGHRLEVFYFKK